MAPRLTRFSAAELSAAIGGKLSRGRPSNALRSELEAGVKRAIESGRVKISKGQLVRQK